MGIAVSSGILMFLRLKRKGPWRRQDRLQNKIRRKLKTTDIKFIIINVVWSSNPVQTASIAHPAVTSVCTVVL
jgi:ribosomal protein L32E